MTAGHIQYSGKRVIFRNLVTYLLCAWKEHRVKCETAYQTFAGAIFEL
mgnify:CR=1 FL=1